MDRCIVRCRNGTVPVPVLVYHRHFKLSYRNFLLFSFRVLPIFTSRLLVRDFVLSFSDQTVFRYSYLRYSTDFYDVLNLDVHRRVLSNLHLSGSWVVQEGVTSFIVCVVSVDTRILPGLVTNYHRTFINPYNNFTHSG